MRNYKISKPTYYSIIPADVRYDKDLMDKAKLIYSEITALSNSMGYCYASNQYFADLYSITIRQVQTLLKDLSNKGYIKVDRNSKPRKIHIATVKFSSSYREENFMVDREENFTHNNTSNNNKKNNTPSPELVSEFKEWYSKYPHPRNEQQTMKNYIKARKTYSAEQLMTALNNYLAEIEEQHTDKRYIKHSTNFVGQEQAFVDYLDTKAVSTEVSTEENSESYFATIEAEDPEYAARLRRRDNDV